VEEFCSTFDGADRLTERCRSRRARRNGNPIMRMSCPFRTRTAYIDEARAMIFYSPALMRRECLRRCLVGSLLAENALRVLTDLGGGDCSQCEGARGFASARIYGKTGVPGIRLARGTDSSGSILLFLPVECGVLPLEWNQSTYVSTFVTFSLLSARLSLILDQIKCKVHS